MKRRLALLGALVLLAVPAAARAQGFSVGQRLTDVLTATPVDPAWFSPTFLAELPAGDVDARLAKVRAQAGAFQKVESGGDGVYVVRYATATQIAFVGIDADAKITLLILWPPQTVAPGDPGRAQVEAIMSRPLQSDTFAASMLGAAPLVRLQEAVNELRVRFGRFVSLDGGDGLYRATMANGVLWVAVHLDENGAVDLLRFTAAPG